MSAESEAPEVWIPRIEQRDHERAAARGRQLEALASGVVSALAAAGILPNPGDARVVIFGVLADRLYGNTAIDVPDLRRGHTEGGHGV